MKVIIFQTNLPALQGQLNLYFIKIIVRITAINSFTGTISKAYFILINLLFINTNIIQDVQFLTFIMHSDVNICNIRYLHMFLLVILLFLIICTLS